MKSPRRGIILPPLALNASSPQVAAGYPPKFGDSARDTKRLPEAQHKIWHLIASIAASRTASASELDAIALHPHYLSRLHCYFALYQSQVIKLFPQPLAPLHSGLFVTRVSSYKYSSFWTRRLLDGQEIEAACVDTGANSHVKNSGKKKKTGREHRQDA